VVHLGVGGFHRAHQALYFDDLADRRISTAWGVVGVGLRTGAVGAALKPQDGLYTLVERDEAGDRPRVIGALKSYHHAPRERAAVLDALTDPSTKVVTLTITGGGYLSAAADGGLDVANSEVLADLERPREPSTAPGFLVEALRLRRQAGHPPFTVMSCDNVPANGEVTRSVVGSMARLRDDGLGDWIEGNVAFPSSVVDRITPGTSPALRRVLAKGFGLWDRSPVAAEPFRQWIIEDEFCNERPPLQEVGAQFVSSASQHELVKKRLLNGGHTAIAYLGVLCGLERIDDVMRCRPLRRFLGTLMEREVAPLLSCPAGLDLDGYMHSLLDRFANRRVADPLARLCARGSVKVPAYLLPSIEDAIGAGREHDGLTLALSGWFLYLREGGNGSVGAVCDPAAERLQGLARQSGLDPRPLLGERDLFGDLADNEEFAKQLEATLRGLDRVGVTGMVESYLHAHAAVRA